MAKKKAKKRTKTTGAALQGFDVYEQSDGSLVVLSVGDEPDDSGADHLGAVDAVDERDAIRMFKSANKSYRKVAVANPDHDPDANTDVQKDAERRTNARLGITSRPSKKKKGARTTRAAKSGAKKKATKRPRKSSRR
jgi:hypothetical protein